MWTRRLAAALVGAAVFAGAAAAAVPTEAQRAAVLRALPASWKRVPARCVGFDVGVDRTGRWASVAPTFPLGDPGCVRYASNGAYVLAARPRWHVVFSGSDPPPCRLRVPRDLAPACTP